MTRLLPLLAALLLAGCVTVYQSDGTTRRRIPAEVEYAHVFAWDYCPHVGWMKSSEATVFCRCFDEMGNVLPACVGEPGLPKIVRNGVVIYDPKDYFK